MAVIWVVAADGGMARVFVMEGKHHGLREIEGLMSVDAHRPSREIASDRPGRAFSSVGSGRSAMDETDPHRFAKHAFAKQVADMLDEQCSQYDMLVIAAPAKALGDLRKCMSQKVSSKIIAELSKDLTHASPHELSQQLAIIIDYREVSYDPAREQYLKRR
ncbi:host attachment protein [bacterium]|nr:host attachment protein [bacterium]